MGSLVIYLSCRGVIVAPNVGHQVFVLYCPFFYASLVLNMQYNRIRNHKNRKTVFTTKMVKMKKKEKNTPFLSRHARKLVHAQRASDSVYNEILRYKQIWCSNRHSVDRNDLGKF